MKKIVLLTIAIFVVFVFGKSDTLASTIEVDTLEGGFKDNGNCSLMEAVLSANTDSESDACVVGNGDDDIIITVPGEIILSKTIYLDSNLTINGNSNGTIINARNAGGAFWLDFFNITLSNLEITGGAKSPIVNILSYDSGDPKENIKIILENLFIHNNDAVAVNYKNESYAERQVVVEINNSLIENNRGEDVGGVWLNECPRFFMPMSLHINNSIIRNNEGVELVGGIYNECGHLVVNDVTISGNVGRESGGIFVNNGKMVEWKEYRSTVTEIYNTTIVGNSKNIEDEEEEQDKEGDGRIEKGSYKEEDVKIGGVDFDVNRGGGIFVFNEGEESSEYDPRVIIKNSTIADNGGGGIFAERASLSISNTVVADNKDINGGVTDQCFFDLDLVKNIGNFATDKTCMFETVGSTTGLSKLGKNGGAVPIGPLGQYGYILTMAINDKSPLYDAGDNRECLKFDARGVSRPQESGCDIGAYEEKSKISVIEDADFDGIADEEENQGPNGGDINNDGIPDAEQPEVTVYKNDIVDGYVAVELQSPECSKSIHARYYKENDLPDIDPEYDYELGLHGSDIDCDVWGGTTTVVYYWDKEYDTSRWHYRKYIANKHKFVDFSDKVTYGTAKVGDKVVTTVTFQLTDGGEYDSDGVVNGIIVDPAGPVMIEEFAGTGSIGNTIWLDSNGNGRQDEGEIGLEDIRVKLIWYGANGKYDHGKKDDIVLRTDTNHNGHYIFEDLPEGKYRVVVKEEDVERYVQTYDPGEEMNGVDVVDLSKGQNYTKADFGYINQEWQLAKTGEDWVSLWKVLLLKMKE